MFEEQKEMVIKWADARGILEKSNPEKQYLKSCEELRELIEGIMSVDRELIVDSIGDYQVTLILFAELIGAEFVIDDDLSSVTKVNITPSVIASVISSDHLTLAERICKNGSTDSINDCLSMISHRIKEVCGQINKTPSECLEVAINEILSRTGKMVDGIFVKSEDMEDK